MGPGFPAEERAQAAVVGVVVADVDLFTVGGVFPDFISPFARRVHEEIGEIAQGNPLAARRC